MIENHNKVIKTTIADLCRIEHDIIFAKYHSMYLDNVEYLDELSEGIKKLIVHQKNLLLFDASKVKGASKEFRQASTKNRGYTKAIAIVVGSAILKILVNIFISFNKPEYPTKMFTKKEDAVQWLLTFEQT
ncbi:MAG: STAS/SEC14 domain-containing protein [Saprospiraceae bacterium]|nr:STAS/SEC14 domain-containing protein [Saprospiraceae bacterium]